ncbi:MAG: sugar phosphate isomerase/epimerase [Chloroflexi bacterium AL-W]|nr:sugar phosphate isomerase/epimerase [Chloroflexi bacterium AL-N1]NOK66025.1 sugar phosphate isomerase/epimerase [Chloroflexi bacterium AL-N10]NOK72906.1 sugar phosphate isomerase/epimerase [Chloroflexi bacterium AL-N5]NOK79803.1 sugar phosphate isomerase/epimerase [Chloroflexi bacterium AL-W]NOK88341.1 sugar phosphate isomerase/epimerase [Chloroflexi bacterium AL-N15]
MPAAIFTLSAFGDEIIDDLAIQLEVLAAENVRYLELRGAWGKNVLDLDHDELQRARTMLDELDFGVSAIGSPIGKSDLSQPAVFEMERLERAIVAAEALNTRLIRVFSFFVPQDQAAQNREEILERMGQLTRRAEQVGVILVHENEKDIYGDVPQRCQDLMQSINSPSLRMAFDPANFVQVGVRPMEEAWPLLADDTIHIHIKDAVFADSSVCPAGEGDGAVPELLATLVERHYEGFLTLEPHLKIAGPAGGVSGADGMQVAIHALRQLLDTLSDIDVK